MPLHWLDLIKLSSPVRLSEEPMNLPVTQTWVRSVEYYWVFDLFHKQGLRDMTKSLIEGGQFLRWSDDTNPQRNTSIVKMRTTVRDQTDALIAVLLFVGYAKLFPDRHLWPTDPKAPHLQIKLDWQGEILDPRS